MEYKFDGLKFASKGVTHDLPAALVIYLWGLIEERKKKDLAMDYLQIIELEPQREEGKRSLEIRLRQEVPPYEEVHTISKFTNIKDKIYVIDDIDYVTMILAEEY